MQDIEILNEEKRSLARGLDVIEQARFWFHHRLQDIDEHRGSMENSTRFKTTTLLSRDDLSKLSARIEALVKVIGSLFETMVSFHVPLYIISYLLAFLSRIAFGMRAERLKFNAQNGSLGKSYFRKSPLLPLFTRIAK